jgi:shikimate kinase
VRVLLTGMSGVGKSALVSELRRRGLIAFDADDDGFSEPREDGRWGWRIDRVTAALDGAAGTGRPVFFAGCSEEQARIPFDCRVLLTAPAAAIAERLTARTTNPYGRSPEQRAQVLSDLADIEPLLRRSADLIVDTSQPTSSVADAVLAHLLPPQS